MYVPIGLLSKVRSLCLFQLSRVLLYSNEITKSLSGSLVLLCVFLYFSGISEEMIQQRVQAQVALQISTLKQQFDQIQRRYSMLENRSQSIESERNDGLVNNAKLRGTIMVRLLLSFTSHYLIVWLKVVYTNLIVFWLLLSFMQFLC